MDFLLAGLVALRLVGHTVSPARPELERSSQLELAGLATLQQSDLLPGPLVQVTGPVGSL